MTMVQSLNKGAIPADTIDAIAQRLDANAPVRSKLPAWGRVHIDRPLPFLCVYRRPAGRADPGTESLLLGEAAYILALEATEQKPGLERLIGQIAQARMADFGAFLILELWSAVDAGATALPADTPGAPAFRIVASRHHAPANYLEALEDALLGICLNGLPARVTLDYRDQVGPPGQAPLRLPVDAGEGGLSLIGLEVQPGYRDPDSGALLPFRLRRLRHAMAHALKQSFYAFARRYTTQRPAHYHELGRHAMTRAVWETDAQLNGISKQFDILLHVTPVNAPAAWAEFQRRGCQGEPEFNYRPRPVEPDLLKRRLYQIPIEEIEDPTLAQIFTAKRDELDRQITLIADRNTPRFLHGSQQIYGAVEDGLLQLAHQLVEQIPPPASPGTGTQILDAEALAARAGEELAWYRQAMPDLPAQVELRDDVPGIMVSRGHFLVGRDARIAVDRLNAILAHELGTHIVTYYNGRSQPFRQLYAGLANYEVLQEGLAVLAEYLVGEMSAARLRLLAGRVLAVSCLTTGADFVATFRELTRRHAFDQDVAFSIAMRVYRGGGYTKDAVYLRGLAQLLDYLGKGGDIDLLLLGKVNLEHAHLVEELRWRKVLKPGPLRPRHLESPEAMQRLEHIRQGMTISRLAEECAR